MKGSAEVEFGRDGWCSEWVRGCLFWVHLPDQRADALRQRGRVREACYGFDWLARSAESPRSLTHLGNDGSWIVNH